MNHIGQQDKKQKQSSGSEKDQSSSNDEDVNSSAKKKSQNEKNHLRNSSHCCKHEELQKQLQEEIVQKQTAEIESLRQKNLEVMQQKAELENSNKSQNFRILELQSQLNAKDAILKEKNQEIKKLYLQNETLKIDIKHIDFIKNMNESSLNSLLSPPTKKNFDKTSPNSNSVVRKSQRKGSFYSEANNQNQKEKIDQSQVEYQKELSVKSVNLPRRGTNKLATESSQFIKDEKFNKSVNQYYSTNSNSKIINQGTGSSQKISIEKINSEIKQLKNSLMSTDRLLRTQRTKNQVLSEKVNQAETIKTNLEVLPKGGSGSNINIVNQPQQQNSSNQYSSHQQNFENSQQDQDVNLSLSQKIYQNSEKITNNPHAQFRNLINKQLNANNPSKDNQTFNENRLNQVQLNETDQSEIHGGSNFTPRDLSQNMPTPIRYPIPAFQDKSYLNDDQQLNQQFINHEQNFTLQNQTPFEINNESQQAQTPSNLNSTANQFLIQQQQQQQLPQQNQQSSQYQSQQQIPHSYSLHQQSQQNQQQQQALPLTQNQQQSTSKLKNLLNEQFNDNISQHSRSGVNQSNINNYNTRPTIDNYYNHQLSNNGSHNQFLSPDQSSQKQFSYLLNKRAMSNQQLYPPSNGQQQQQQQQQQYQQKSSQNLMQIQQTPQHSQVDRQPSQNLSEIPMQDKLNNNVLDQSYRGIQQQQINNSPYQQQPFMQPRYSQPLFNSQFNQVQNTQSPNSVHQNMSYQNNYPQQNQQQNLNTYHSTLMTQGHPPSIYYPPPLPNNQQNSQSHFYQPTNNTLQLSGNLSQNQYQFSNYLNTYPNNLNRSSLNTISSIKGENLKKLNQQLTELELEKNLIETKIMKEESKKYGKSVNRNAAIQDLTLKLQQVCAQIEEIRFSMMEQAM